MGASALRLLREPQAAPQLGSDGVVLDVTLVLGFGPASLRASGAVRLSEIVGLSHLGPGNRQARQGDDDCARDQH